MHIRISGDERITAQCVIPEFTCILTSTRLIVTTATEEQSCFLEDIAAIGVCQDRERSRRNLIRENIERGLLGAGCGFLYGTALGFSFLHDNLEIGFIIMVTFMAMGIPISLLMPLKKTKEAVLKIVFKQSPCKQYSFTIVSTNEHLVKTFAAEVFKQVATPAKKNFTLN